MIGQTIWHYRVLKKIGEGGIGQVYLAEDTSLDRKVALKFLPEQFIQDRERLGILNGTAHTQGVGDEVL